MDFLSKYETSNDVTEEILKYMNENEVEPDEAAKWWMNRE